MIRYVIFSFFCFSLLSPWSTCFLRAESRDRVVIKVEGRSITTGELERIAEITSFENGVSKKLVWSSIAGLVDRLVDNYLILAYGREKRVFLSDMELERAIQDIVKDYPENSFKEILVTRCIDYNEWKERLRDKLLINKIVKGEIESLDPVSYRDIKAYYQEKKEDFRHASRAQFLHIVTMKRRDAEAIHARISRGEDMAQLAREQSAHIESIGDCGEDWHTRDSLPQPLSDVVFTIPVDELSTIIKTSYGFHVIKVLQREPAGEKELLEVRDEIEKKLLSQKIEKGYSAWLRGLRDRYHVTVNYTLLDEMRARNESN